MIQTKHADEQPADDDGFRILVEKVWPKGLANEDAKIDFWAKEVAPSSYLQRQLNHDPKTWNEFRNRYRNQLRGNEELDVLRTVVREKDAVTFVHSAKDNHHNAATVLKELLE